jgi:RNA polymerase sigma-70 factor (sigma-E family)
MMVSIGRPLRAARSGDRDAAVSELYVAHWPGLVRFALLLLGDRPSAEDVTQEAFTELYRRWETIREPAKAPGYLRTTVLNRSRTLLRRRKLARLHLRGEEPPTWSAEYDALLGEDRREVLVALAALPPRRREVLVMRFYLNLTDAEIAETLGISEVTVRSTASRALTALARALEETR